MPRAPLASYCRIDFYNSQIQLTIHTRATIDHVKPAIRVYPASPSLHVNWICTRMQNCFICIFRFLPRGDRQTAQLNIHQDETLPSITTKTQDLPD